MRERTDNAALCLQRCWRRRPRWSAPYALEKLEDFLDSRPQSGAEVSKAERRRLSALGILVPVSLAYSETPVGQFAALLDAVAAQRDRSMGTGPDCRLPEGLIRGRLGGTFYELGCGRGLLVYAATLLHDFDRAVGFEILPGLHDECVQLQDHFKTSVRGRLLRRADRPMCDIKFTVGDAISLKWSIDDPPSVVFCHSSCFDGEVMRRLGLRLATLPPQSFIATFTFPVPTVTTPGGTTIRFNLVERVVLLMPWGPVTAFVQQRAMTDDEEVDYGRMAK